MTTSADVEFFAHSSMVKFETRDLYACLFDHIRQSVRIEYDRLYRADKPLTITVVTTVHLKQRQTLRKNV